MFVIHHRRTPEGAEQLAREIQALGRKAEILAGDLSDVNVPVRIIDEAFEKWAGWMCW